MEGAPPTRREPRTNGLPTKLAPPAAREARAVEGGAGDLCQFRLQRCIIYKGPAPAGSLAARTNHRTA